MLNGSSFVNIKVCLRVSVKQYLLEIPDISVMIVTVKTGTAFNRTKAFAIGTVLVDSHAASLIVRRSDYEHRKKDCQEAKSIAVYPE